MKFSGIFQKFLQVARLGQVGMTLNGYNFQFHGVYRMMGFHIKSQAGRSLSILELVNKTGGFGQRILWFK